MSYEYDFAVRLKKLKERSKFEAAWYRATCTVKNPLTFSILDGNLIYKTGEGLILTRQAAGWDWEAGDTAASILSGDGLLLIDRI